jgi:hypothetical protein
MKIKFQYSGLFTGRFPDVMDWLLRSMKTEATGLRPLLHLLLKRLDRIERTRGTIALINYVKDVRLVLWNYLAQTSDLKVPKGVKVTKDGIPQVFGDLIPLIRRGDSPALLQMLNTILTASRSLQKGSKADTSTITDPTKSSLSYNITEYADDFFRTLGYRCKSEVVPSSIQWKRFHFSAKTGPSSLKSNALWSCFIDLYNLPESLIESLKIIGGEKFSKAIDLLIRAKPLLQSLGVFPIGEANSVYRKLSSFPDKELKVRVIGILDYFSQSCLRPLHSYLYKILRRIDQDVTFDQGRFKELLVNDPNSIEIFYSADLSAATDRFPIEVIANLLKSRLPTRYVDAWKDVMVGYPFSYEGKMISYSVGNPMGAYSS